MQTTKLTLNEIYGLESELFGLTNPQSGEVIIKGLLSQSLTLKNRYWLSRLGESIQEEKKAVDTLRDSLIKELGTEENGNFSLNPMIDEKPNPNFIKFQEELSSLLKEEKGNAFPCDYGLKALDRIGAEIDLTPSIDFAAKNALPFRMTIEDTYSITGRGTVAAGKVEAGTLKVGEVLELIGKNKTIKIEGWNVFIVHLTIQIHFL